MRRVGYLILMVMAAAVWGQDAPLRTSSLTITGAPNTTINTAWITGIVRADEAEVITGAWTLAQDFKTSDSAGGTWFLQDNAGSARVAIPQSGAPYLAGDWGIGTNGAASGDRTLTIYSDSADKYGQIISQGDGVTLKALGASNPATLWSNASYANIKSAPNQAMYLDMGGLLNLRDADASNTVRSNWDSADGCWDVGRLEIGGTEVISAARLGALIDLNLTDAGAPTLTMTSTSSSASDDPKIQMTHNATAGGDAASISLLGSATVPTVAVASSGATTLRVDAAAATAGELRVTAGGAPTQYYGALNVSAAGKVSLTGTANGEIVISDGVDIVRLDTTSDAVGVMSAPDTSTGYELKTADFWATGKIQTGGATIHVPATANITAVSATIPCATGVVYLTADGNYTLSSNPSIADGVSGQILWLVNTDATDTITLSDTLGINVNSATIAIGPADAVGFIYNGTDWIQLTPVVAN